MILGYTLTTFPKVNKRKKQQQKHFSTELRAVIEEGPCIIGEEFLDIRFSTQQGNN